MSLNGISVESQRYGQNFIPLCVKSIYQFILGAGKHGGALLSATKRTDSQRTRGILSLTLTLPVRISGHKKLVINSLN